MYISSKHVVNNDRITSDLCKNNEVLTSKMLMTNKHIYNKIVNFNLKCMVKHILHINISITGVINIELTIFDIINYRLGFILILKLLKKHCNYKLLSNDAESLITNKHVIFDQEESILFIDKFDKLLYTFKQETNDIIRKSIEANQRYIIEDELMIESNNKNNVSIVNSLYMTKFEELRKEICVDFPKIYKKINGYFESTYNTFSQDSIRYMKKADIHSIIII